MQAFQKASVKFHSDRNCQYQESRWLKDTHRTPSSQRWKENCTEVNKLDYCSIIVLRRMSLLLNCLLLIIFGLFRSQILRIWVCFVGTDFIYFGFKLQLNFFIPKRYLVDLGHIWQLFYKFGVFFFHVQEVRCFW